MKFSFNMLILLFLTIALILSPGCSCSSKRVVKTKKKEVSQTKFKVKKFLNPLSMYIKEIKFIRKKNRLKKIQSMRQIYSTRKEIMGKRTDFLEMHTFLKGGATLFREKKYDEALKEFKHVIAQYPEDIELQAIATKNISICYKKKGDMRDFIKYYKKYYELLDEIPEDEDDY